MPAPARKALTSLDKTGAYFQRTIGVLPSISEDYRRAAVAHTARHAVDKRDFINLTNILGLDEALDGMAGQEWRNAG